VAPTTDSVLEICRADEYTPPPSGKQRQTTVYAHATATITALIAARYSTEACPV
jgi:hypothetical protein